MTISKVKLMVVLLGVFALGYLFYPHVQPVEYGASSAMAAVSQTTPAQDRPISSLRDLNNAFVEIAREVRPTVVTVFTEKTLKVRQNPMMFDPFAEFFGQGRQNAPEREFHQQGLGSGVIISADGNIITNHHVVADADSIFVRLSDDRRFPAKVLGSDPKTDIAVIKIDAGNLPAIKIGSSNDLQVGEMVLAVGSPMSENLAQTVTQGIVSAKGRSNIGLADYEDFIQTDAAINPGNSGGALVNLDGELIGINSAIASQSGGSQGIGFAVPIDMAMNIMKSLLANGKVIRGWLGVSIQDINDAIAGAMNLKDQTGALVGDVLPDGPADKAGMQAGDIILAMNGQQMANASQLRNTVAGTPPGTKVDLTVLRDGDKRELSVELGELPGELAAAAGGALSDLLGFEVASLDKELARKYELNPSQGGVVVTAIDPNSSAFNQGLREGDLISGINKNRITGPSDFSQALGQLKKGDTVLIRIVRQDRGFFLAFEL